MISLISCNNEKKLNGNYYSFNKRHEYTEYYFKQDSLRIATENDWVKLSDWKKIIIRDDTLYFETFGEWRELRKAKINYLKQDKINLLLDKFNDTIFLIRLDDKIQFNDLEEFWSEFEERKNSRAKKHNFIGYSFSEK